MNDAHMPLHTLVEVNGCNYLTASQICVMFRIGKTTLHRWVTDGEFPRPICVGKRSMRWAPRQVQAYIAEKNALAAGLGEKRSRGRPRTSMPGIHIASSH